MPRSLTGSPWRQRLGFVAVSGAGWLLDTFVFMALSGPGGWGVTPANMAGGVCGTLLVFAVSARAIFRPNGGPVLQKLLVLLPFNLLVITVSSVVLGALAHAMVGWAGGWNIPPDAVRFAAKVLVTPFTLALNFVVVRYLLERFIGVRRAALGGAP